MKSVSGRPSLCESCAFVDKSTKNPVFSYCNRFEVFHGRVAKCISYEGPALSIDIVIVTATAVETEAVVNHLLPNGPAGWSTIAEMTEYEWRRAEFINPTNPKEKYRIVLAEARLKGLPAAAVQATRAWHHFQPQYLMMLGITAGREKDTALGDIVVPDLVFDYGAGKWIGKKFTPAPHQLETENQVFRACKFLATRKDLLSNIVDEWDAKLPKGSSTITIRFGHMVSGAAVIDSKETWTRILNQDKDVIAIDMEAYSLLLTGRQVGPPNPIVLVAKSVCDYGVAKNNNAQAFAAFTSARFGRMFIEEILFKDRGIAVTQS